MSRRWGSAAPNLTLGQTEQICLDNAAAARASAQDARRRLERLDLSDPRRRDLAALIARHQAEASHWQRYADEYRDQVAAAGAGAALPEPSGFVGRERALPPAQPDRRLPREPDDDVPFEGG